MDNTFKDAVKFAVLITAYAFAFQFLLADTGDIMIPILHIYLRGYITLPLVSLFVVTWLCYSPLRKACCDGSLSELLFQIVPLEIVGLFHFAKWHFFLALLFLTGFVVSVVLLGIRLFHAYDMRPASSARAKRYFTAFQKGIVFLALLFTMIPCGYALAAASSSPVFQADPTLTQELFPEDVSADDGDGGENVDAPYTDHLDLFPYLRENTWPGLSLDERITVLQRLVDLETEVFGIPTVPIVATVLDYNTLGDYSHTLGLMRINAEVLADYEIYQVLDVICHEVFHSYQHYIIDNTDWDSPLVDTPFYASARRWKANIEDYKDAGRDGQEAYYDQSLERDARRYAELETNYLLYYIGGQKLDPLPPDWDTSL